MNLLIYPSSKGKRQKAKGKNAEKNPGVFKLFILSCSFALFVLSFNFLSPVPSFAQCQTNNRNEGLISAGSGITGLFGNSPGVNPSAGVCVTGNNASYRFKLPTYQGLEDQYYVLSRSPARKSGGLPIIDGVLTFSDNGIYLHSGDLTITNTPTGSGTQVIFVKGKLDIQSDIDYADTNANSGLVFIVNGDINIYSNKGQVNLNVRKVNAVLISFGQICTAYLAASSTCANGTTDITDDLTINGSLISFYNPTSNPDEAIKFRRNLSNNFLPAEIINQQPKYLYILRNGLFTKDLIITTEDRHYQISP